MYCPVMSYCLDDVWTVIRQSLLRVFARFRAGAGGKEKEKIRNRKKPKIGYAKSAMLSR